MTKTNVMRLLEAAGIAYRTAEYEYDEANLSGLHAAEQVGMDAEQVFKTLVTRGDKTGILVFCIPVDMELDLKKAASVSSLPPFFKGYFVGLPNRYTFFYRQEHRVFFCHVECLIPSTDLRQCTVYAPFTQ